MGCCDKLCIKDMYKMLHTPGEKAINLEREEVKATGVRGGDDSSARI